MSQQGDNSVPTNLTQIAVGVDYAKSSSSQTVYTSYPEHSQIKSGSYFAKIRHINRVLRLIWYLS